MTMGMTSRLLVAGLAACLLPVAASAQGKPGAAARITTGTVERADRTRLDSNATPGALVGGTLGLLSASGKSDGRKARNAIIGAGAGAMIANAAQGSRAVIGNADNANPCQGSYSIQPFSPRKPVQMRSTCASVNSGYMGRLITSCAASAVSAQPAGPRGTRP